MTAVFVTGGLGFIGYHLCSMLLNEGHSVAIYDAAVSYLPVESGTVQRQFAYRRNSLSDRGTLTTGDTQDYVRLSEALMSAQPEVVVHLAAIPLPAICNAEPLRAAQVNLTGTAALLAAIRTVASVRRVVFVSSSYVLGHFRREPADEAHPTSPIDVYGSTKLAGEVLVTGLARSVGLEWVIVRPSAVYGPTDANRRVVQVFIENALAGQPIVVQSGESRLDFTYCEDVAAGLVLAALHPQAANQVFHMTRGQARSINELAHAVALMVPGSRVVNDTRPSEAPTRGTLDIAKAQALLGYRPLVSLEDGVARYVAFMRSHGLVDEQARLGWQ